MGKLQKYYFLLSCIILLLYPCHVTAFNSPRLNPHPVKSKDVHETIIAGAYGQKVEKPAPSEDELQGDTSARLKQPDHVNFSIIDGVLSLRWTEVAGAASYQVFRSDKKDGEYQLVANVKGVIFTDSDIIEKENFDRSFFYKILSKDESSTSGGDEVYEAKVTPSLPRRINSLLVGDNVLVWGSWGSSNGLKFRLYQDGGLIEEKLCGESWWSIPPFYFSVAAPKEQRNRKYTITEVYKNGLEDIHSEESEAMALPFEDDPATKTKRIMELCAALKINQYKGLKYDHWQYIDKERGDSIIVPGSGYSTCSVCHMPGHEHMNYRMRPQKSAGWTLRLTGMDAVEPLIAVLNELNGETCKDISDQKLEEIKKSLYLNIDMDTLKLRCVEYDEGLKRIAIDALKDITRQDFSDDTEKWRNWYEHNKSK